MEIIDLDSVIILRGLTVPNATAFSGVYQMCLHPWYVRFYVVICHGLSSFTGHWKRFPSLRRMYQKYVITSVLVSVLVLCGPPCFVNLFSHSLKVQFLMVTDDPCIVSILWNFICSLLTHTSILAHTHTHRCVQTGRQAHTHTLAMHVQHIAHTTHDTHHKARCHLKASTLTCIK